MGTPIIRQGQVIAIPVLTRHINTSSGACAIDQQAPSSNCVMADAIRDRFPTNTAVSVGSGEASIDLPGLYFNLQASPEMRAVIRKFDGLVDDVINGSLDYAEAKRRMRRSIPRVVHATVVGVVPTESYSV